ncbi:hypothetical protein D9757_006726 [Collybiopsis confluens]|uniref:PSP1 C-terminal domain-containing protein n=1 Tax=Collybiopsis confluens TaxID=2823264 RepID=A0A8H5M8T0_9AGAR|nr:hypothetical protein D9757_006726 [Collybiopsis confluens]
MSQQHSSPSPNAEDRPNRFADPTLANLPSTAGAPIGRAASQPPRSSSAASSQSNFLPSPTAPRSPWSQTQSSAKHTRETSQSRYLSPSRASGVPMPSQTRSASFSGGGLAGLPHSFSSSTGGSGYFSRFGSTFEDDESAVDDPDPSYRGRGGEFDGEDDVDDVDAMIGRLRPSVAPDAYDEYSDSPVYARRGVGIVGSSVGGGGGVGRYGGGGRLPPSLSSSLSPSQLPVPVHNTPHGYTRDTSGLGSTMASWNGNDSDHTFALLRERIGTSRPRYGSYNDYNEYGDKSQVDTSNQSPFLRDVSQIMREDGPLRELWDQANIGSGGGGGPTSPRGIGLRTSLSRAYSGTGGGGGFGRASAFGGGTDLEDIPGSGATSRRHSVSVVQPVRRGSAHGLGLVGDGGAGDLGGSALDDEYEYGLGGRAGHGGGGLGAMGMAAMGRTASMGGGVHHPSIGSSGSGDVGRGSLMLSDEDLLDAAAPMPGGMHGGIHALNNFGMMNLNDINQSLYQHQQQQSALDIPQPRRGSVSPGTGSGSHDGLDSSPGGHHRDERDSQEHTPQQSAQSSQPPQGLEGLAAGTSYAARARASSQSHGGTSPTMGRGVVPLPQGYYSGQPPQQGPNYSVGMSRRISNAGGAGPVLDLGYGGGVGLHGHHPSHSGSGHPQQQQQHPGHPHHGQHTLHPQQQVPSQQPEHSLGRGVPLSSVPVTWKLFIVEFKAGRTDLFYLTDAVKTDIMRNEAMNGNGQSHANGHGHRASDGSELGGDSSASSSNHPIKVGDLVIVEADRGKDLGRVVNDNITAAEIEAWLEAGRSASGQAIDSSQWNESSMATPISPTGVYAGLAPPTPITPAGGPGTSTSKREINPKQIYAKAGPAEASVLAAKMSDEMKALQLCQSKVRAKKLPMEVVDAEYQWDRRKLTFYFVAEKRIDFRELVRELFRLYKTRIWMASLQGGGGYEQ